MGATAGSRREWQVAVLALGLVSASLSVHGSRGQGDVPRGQLAPPRRAERMEKALPKSDLGSFPVLDLSKCPRDRSGERIVAIVEGTTITEKRFLAELAFARAQQKFTQFPVPKSKQEEQHLLGALAAPVFDQLMERILLAKYAREHGIVVTDAEIDEAIRRTDRTLGPGEKLEDMARAFGLTMEDVREMARTQILGARLEEAMADKVPEPSEAELRDFAAKYPGVVGVGEEIRAAHIFFAAPRGATTETVTRAELLARRVRQLLELGADFCELALRYSQDPKTSTRCGDLGYLTRGTMPKTFDEVAFKLPPGQVSDVIRSDRGFHIIMVREKHANCLRASYQRYQQRLLFVRWWEDLKRRAKVEKFF